MHNLYTKKPILFMFLQKPDLFKILLSLRKYSIKNIIMKEIGTININNTFINDIRAIINTARSNAVRSVDFQRVQMYWHLGKRIFKEEQQGKQRAYYGTYLIKNLAKQLEPEYGSGFCVSNWNVAVNFTGCFQLRPQCGRN